MILARLHDIEQLYETRGHLFYGEGVTQIAHALQCADLARQDGAPKSLIVAAFLHDIGHLLTDDESLALQGYDDRHEIVGAQALKFLFGPSVRGPLALHVSAKRYLCFKQPAYVASLSDASRHSLNLQGGPFSREEGLAFERLPYWREAVCLRRYDDLGKRTEPSASRFSDVRPLLTHIQREAALEGPGRADS